MTEVSKVMTMKDAISKFVKDGMTLFISAVWANHAASAAHEIIRQGKKDLTLIESSPGEIFDQMVGAGCVKKIMLSWSANEAFGTGYRYRKAVQEGIIEVEDYSNFGLTAKLMAGAMGIPFMPIMSQKGSSINEIRSFLGENKLKHIECPFTKQKVTLIPGINPDISIIHCQRADTEGNLQTWGSLFSAKYGAQSGKTIIASVEEIVDTDTIRRNPELTLVPASGWPQLFTNRGALIRDTSLDIMTMTAGSVTCTQTFSATKMTSSNSGWMSGFTAWKTEQVTYPITSRSMGISA